MLPRFINLQSYSNIHFRMFLYLVTCFLGVTVSLLCLLQVVSKLTCMFQFISIQFVKGDEIVRPCDRNRNETETLREHDTKYKTIQKWIAQFPIKFQNRGIKIAQVNSILITKSINLHFYFNFVRCWGSVMTFLTNYQPTRAQSINK